MRQRLVVPSSSHFPRHSPPTLPLLLATLLLLLLAYPPQPQAAPQPWTLNPGPCHVIIPTPPNAPLLPVPPSFLGLSHEPLTIISEVLSHPTYLRLLSLLSSFHTGPFILRWGGGKQDELNHTLGREHWAAMRQANHKLGVRFTLGLNLLARDPDLAAAQVHQAMLHLPPEAILSFGPGNEPDLYTKLNHFPPDYWPGGWFQDMDQYTHTLATVLQRYFNSTKMISGPGVAWNFNWTFGQSQARQFALSPSLRPFASALTAHWYMGRATGTGVGVGTFLAEAKMNTLRDLVQKWVGWGRSLQLPFRLEEFNSLCEGGLRGASDTLGAALLVVDAAMTLIKAGASGMNWHGTMCYAYSPIMFPWLCDPAAVNPNLPSSMGLGQTAGCGGRCGQPTVGPTIGAPFYGLLLTQMALQGLPAMITAPQGRCGLVPNVKLHTLSAGQGAELRLLLIKKNGNSSVNFNVTVLGLYSAGSLVLLTGPGFNSSVADITLGGQQIDAQGEWSGLHHALHVPVSHSLQCREHRRHKSCDQSSSYTITLPAAGAALIVVRRLQFM